MDFTKPPASAAAFIIILFGIFIALSNATSSNFSCIPTERQALLSFKHHLHHPSLRLASWLGHDCCNWSGVVCSKLTPHVHKLLLGDPDMKFYDTEQPLSGEINPALVDLKHLRHLDLSVSRIGGARLPEFLGSLRSLRYLNLSRTSFSGMIPHQLGNLTNLHSLDLGYIYVRVNYSAVRYPYAKNLQWLSQLSSLRYLDMSSIDLEEASDWLEVTNSLPSLEVLHLSSCNLNFNFHPIYHVNFSSLSLLDLSRNHLGNNIPLWVSNLRSLTSLYLRGVANGGSIPDGIQNLTSLVHLDLSYNSFNTSIPSGLYRLSHLEVLNLVFNQLRGPIPEDIQNLTSLVHLDLSSNSFNTSIPSWLYSLSHLEVLNLAGNQLRGTMSSEIKNMTSIITLDLSYNELQGDLPTSSMAQLCKLKEIDLSGNTWNRSISQILDSLSGCVSDSLQLLRIENSQIFGHLTNKIGQFKTLTDLDLSYNSISGPIPTSLGNLSFLTDLDLSYNSISGPIPASLGNLSSLTDLHLSSNSISGPIPASLGNLSSLTYLDLSSNSISGPIPASLGNLSSLTDLDLSSNSISGPIPASLGNLSSLRNVLLSNNHINETLPESLGQLVNLEGLYIYSNQIEGIVSEAHFANTTKLRYLDVSDNHLLTLKVGGDWVTPFQLSSLYMDSLHIGPDFPLWLRSQKKLSDLSLSNTSLKGAIPCWIWDFMELDSLDLSHNQLVGSIHMNISKIGTSAGIFQMVDLSHNNFVGPLPSISPYLYSLDLSNNLLSGSISQFLCDKKNQPMDLVFLNLANNHLAGKISNCWSSNKWQSLVVVDLSYNNFHGGIPSSFGSLNVLKSLYLKNNKLSGEFPLSLQNCSKLLTLDLGENNFSGSIPAWIGKKLLKMRILSLRSNEFHGHMPVQLCALTSLQILDLAYNNLTGYIPQCFNNFSAMVVKRSSENFTYDKVHVGSISMSSYADDVLELVMKGQVVEYRENLKFLSFIDLSTNFLVGHIPTEITHLSYLQSLNLSNNLLTGEIPQEIGKMGELESLDLSGNQLSGEIPPSMSSLSFLSYLNLSNNNLVGRIPLGTQLQGFDNSSYIGNSLCGPPLTQNCSTDVETPIAEKKTGNGDDNGIMPSLYLGMAVGFVVGFWGVCGALFFNRTWRHKYFLLLDDMKDYIYVAYVLTARWFTTKLRGHRQNQ